MKPLCITAYPMMPIICDDYLPIDGILLFSAMQATYGRQEYTLPGEVTNVIVDLPLAKRGDGNEWYYAASSAVWHNRAQGQSFWTKRLRRSDAERIVDFKGKRGKVLIEQGRYKAYQMPVFYQHATRIDWFVVGDEKAIEDLLVPCTHIGKKTAHGWGRVVWKVEAWHTDWSTWHNKRLMRPIPSNNGILYGFRPPYWLPANQTICQMPITKNKEDRSS